MATKKVSAALPESAPDLAPAQPVVAPPPAPQPVETLGAAWAAVPPGTLTHPAAVSSESPDPGARGPGSVSVPADGEGR